MGLFRRLWDLYGLCVTCHIQYGWGKAIDNESVLRKSGRHIFDG
ncbi:hypothetical protein BACDOR_02576 [Phocaeicola dorei DSM 17855]|uniref:Uncharacterized protein n=1 Tax=Phocaeicola dorei DSM 17855 TaxID=483217 RepID=B6VZ56_9BACT|nr:hypothetical protein BACDOR_02576 [Phocaeicola dorei DSM 17855]